DFTANSGVNSARWNTHREAVKRIHAICGKRPSPVDGYFNGLLVGHDPVACGAGYANAAASRSRA
ncbi:hypothetical protein, partial [Burkholderia gladioli]|uniref:hypothetical protein n=1 Tax=Burkholderia gladioli TaxID=28095 RepID=UPI001ABA78A9